MKTPLSIFSKTCMPKNNDPYLIAGSNVLKNKLNLTNQDELDDVEKGYTSLAMFHLRNNPLKIKSVFDIKRIHEALFSDIYDWAGEFRTITMYKKEAILDGCSVDYTPSEYIQKEMDDLDNKFMAVNLNALDNIHKVTFICSTIAELWQIHPFREGNTRSVAIFLYCLLKQNDINLSADFLGRHAGEFRDALVMASLYSKSKPEYLYNILLDITSVKNQEAKRYESITGDSKDKYAYSHHTINKIKTIKEANYPKK